MKKKKKKAEDTKKRVEISLLGEAVRAHDWYTSAPSVASCCKALVCSDPLLGAFLAAEQGLAE